MMASASAMTYTPSVTATTTSGGSTVDTETSSPGDNKLLRLEIPTTNGTTPPPQPAPISTSASTVAAQSRASATKRAYFDSGVANILTAFTNCSDSESPKKRRKQSTPVKIPTCAVSAEMETGPTDAAASVSPTPVESTEEGKLDSPPNLSSSPGLANSTNSPDVFTAKCGEGVTVSQSSPSIGNPLTHSDLFKIDFNASSAGSWLPADAIQNSVKQSSDEWSSGVQPPSLHSIPFTFTSLQSPGLPGQVSSPFPLHVDSNQQQSTGGHLLARPINQHPRIRIFNPDAYCDLCNKEFCNKYFLKTHKANKHGIYTDLPPTEFNFPTTVCTTPNSAIGTAKTITTFTPSIPDQLSNLSSPSPLPSVVPPINSNSSTNLNKLTASTPIDSASSKMTTNLLTASCDICQKKFCNKNFVRRHKAKVHGIVTENDSGDLTEDNSNLDPNTSDSNSETNTTSNQPANTNSPNSNPYYSEGLPDCLKPFIDSELDPDNVQYRWPITSANIQQIRETAAIHRPRGLGIVNPEAFCEICCKEYCNKYFLRTHKLKRHGIAIPLDEPSPNKEPSADGMNIQTSPLNLIKSEQSDNPESGGAADKKDQASDIMMCGICGVHVAQKYMKAHYEACHIIKASPSDNPPAVSTATSSPLSNSGRHFEGSDDPNVLEATSNDKSQNITEENINEDLKKLQTMILQLNNLNVCQIVTCNVCGKEFENKFYLQAHMMSDHGQLYMKITDEKISIQNTTAALANISTNSNESSKSTLQNEQKPDIESVSVHLQQQQRLTPLQHLPSETLLKTENTSMRANVTTPTMPSSAVSSVSSERRTSISLAPTNSYCEICNKELCNKYFMKTHMQRMHGIEIENGAQIGGVVCNICNKELCSKYFLRVHKHNTHGIVEDGMPLPAQSRQSNDDSSHPVSAPSTSDNQLSQPVATQQPAGQYSSTPLPPNDSSLKPNELGDLSHRYFAHFTEVCPICNRRFRSTKWLKAHLVTDHGKAEHDKWEELELIYQKQNLKLQNISGENQSTKEDSPKVSNGNSGNAGFIGGPLISDDVQDSKVGIQNLLSNIFGQDELNSKKYYCSFCNFSTPVLAFLFVHERSHGQPPILSKNENFYQCPICTQSYQTSELLQKHLILQHAAHMPKHLFKLASTTATSLDATDAQTVAVSNDDRQRTPESLPETLIKIKEDTNGNETSRPAPARKDFPAHPASSSLIDLRRLFHSELMQNLTEMSQQIQLPTSYALPNADESTETADLLSDKKKYVMQPFLIEEFKDEATTMGLQLRLVPCLVFLPVRERITTSLTTSIKFTPT